jgi:hypothetical protein
MLIEEGAFFIQDSQLPPEIPLLIPWSTWFSKALDWPESAPCLRLEGASLTKFPLIPCFFPC